MNEAIEQGGNGVTIIKGIIGGAAPMMLAVLNLPEVEQWARILAFGAGFIVSVLTAITLVRNLRK